MIMLAVLMFNAGLGLKISHLKNILRIKHVLLAGLAANLAIPIVYVFGITIAMRLWYEPLEVQHILVGLALVAAMPIAGSSTAWAQNTNGNLALSLRLVFFSTLLSPIVTQITFQNIWGDGIRRYKKVFRGLAAYGSGAFLGLWVVLPSLLGIAARLIVRERWQTGVMPYLKFINSIVLLLLNYSNPSVSLPQAMADRDYDFLAITLAITTRAMLNSVCCGVWPVSLV